ncbi:MAG: single-stranded-DNA-specific exonuclease RecJ [Ruminococcus sp.]|jgi:single-stranded-DNA-specific exonuclease|nr:single-stranded-DNA-specific exonuclease RecJ [Ruminococcus sp.]
MNKWLIKSTENSSALAGKVSPLLGKVLTSLGCKTIEEVNEKLLSSSLQNPFDTKDIPLAVEIITNAINENTKICVYGDYDCDGICATYILYSYLQSNGANLTYYIPERAEGFGMNKDSVRKLKDDGVGLIITVDNGIAAVAEADLCKELDIKLIITDHHTAGEILPVADAIINPHLESDNTYSDLCGTGVAFKLVTALLDGDYELAFEQYGEIVALATVADIVPLDGENRYIVKKGLEMFPNTENQGLFSLLEKAGYGNKPINSTTLSFGLAPRINASGRFGSPKTAFELLTAEDELSAATLTDTLNELNTKRKKTENDITEIIKSQIDQNPELLHGRVLVFSGNSLHHGVIGIVAARIMEKFGKPAFIIAEDGENSVGSVRSFGEFSVYECLDYCSEYLLKYGGHKSAGGFSLKTSEIKNFKNKAEEYAMKYFKNMPVYSINLNCILEPDDLTLSNVEDLSQLEPYGQGNEKPVFLVLRASVVDIKPLSGGIHQNVIVNYGGKTISVLIFRCNTEDLAIKAGEEWDFAVTLDINEYQGRRTVSLIADDYRRSGINQAQYFSAYQAYEKYLRGEELPTAYYRNMTPSKQELTVVYKLIMSGVRSANGLFLRLIGYDVNYCKVRVAIDVFCELGLIGYDVWGDRIKLGENVGKVNLEDSVILAELMQAIA